MKQIFNRLLSTGNALAYLPIRLVAGLTLAAHGAQKLFGWFGGHGLSGTAGFFQEHLNLSPGMFWALCAGGAEFFGGLMLAVGFLTRLGALLTGITMAVAIMLVHPHAFFASDNGMEFPLVLLAVSVTLLISGGGGASVDRLMVLKQRADSHRG